MQATAPKPDFSLTVAPASLTLTSGAAAQTITVSAAAVNNFTGTITVQAATPAGVAINPSSFTLEAGGKQTITATAATSAQAGSLTLQFSGTSGTLSHSAALSLTVVSSLKTAAPDVTTYHYDNARDGLNASESILTPTNVNSAQFGKIGFDPVDGKVDAEPLFLANMNIGGKLRNVLYVVTENDSVYAFDADSGTQLWMSSIVGPGETVSDDRYDGNFSPEIGITSTPVIDRKQGPNGTLFAVGMTVDATGQYHQRLHALDLTTGSEAADSPVEISGSFPSTGVYSQNGNVIFDPAQYTERAALLLLNGNIYLAWTSHADAHPYNGWIMAYSESTLKQTQVFSVTPNGVEGAIWMSGDGLAADKDGNIYFLDANGTVDTDLDSKGFPSKGDFGNSIVKLSTTGPLAVQDYFSPYNSVIENAMDLDLGSGGDILLPDLTDATGKVRHLIVGAGKDTHIYLADRDNLGKFNVNGSDNSNVYQDLSGTVGGDVFSTPAYFNGSLYYCAAGQTLRALPLVAAKLVPTASSQSPRDFLYPGATPSISANGHGAGIVWALESNPSQAAVLHAYDATNLALELYNSDQAPNGRDAFGNGNKFITPMIVNGKVYVGTATGVAVFGLLTQ